MRAFPSDVAFTPAVKAIQEQKGSRKSYARMERGDGWQTTVTPDLAEFLAGPGHVLPGHRERRGAALHPVPRRPARIPEGDRRAHARLRRLRRQPAVRHAGQPVREPEGVPLPDGLREPAGGSRSGAPPAWSKGTRPWRRSSATRRTPARSSGRSCSRSRPGT